MGTKQKSIKFVDKTPRQPEKCKGCFWGKWEAAAQFCSKPLKCVKAEGDQQ